MITNSRSWGKASILNKPSKEIKNQLCSRQKIAKKAQAPFSLWLQANRAFGIVEQIYCNSGIPL